MFIRRFGLLATVFLALLVPATPSLAYEEDTHFLMTDVLCQAAGFSAADALTVAAVDQGMDDSTGTVANGGIGGIFPNIPEEWMWHALDLDGNMGPTGVLMRKETLFGWAKSRPTWQGKLVYLGVFFHYQQDTWAHRHHYPALGYPDDNHTSYDRYVTYNTPFGHARDGHKPDRPPFDPVVAMLCLKDGLKYATQFLKDNPSAPYTPNVFFVNYVANPPGGEMVDGNWQNDGAYFHQLQAVGAPGSAQKFLTDLIREQIFSYSSSLDFNPGYLLRYTPDQADFERTRAALQAVCTAAVDSIGVQINVHSKADKEAQQFESLTTAELLPGTMTTGKPAGWVSLGTPHNLK